jgi:predicted homoserine dehydrogenase-like protein
VIIIDTALQQRQQEGNPIRVGMVGAGFMGRGLALQILGVVPGMDLVAISNRHLDGAKRAYEEAGVFDVAEVKTASELDSAIENGQHAITDDAMLICRAEHVDVVLEVTGAIEFGATVALEAIANRKHIVVMNAELDGTVGSLLKVRADQAGVIYTNTDGDQPGTTMNLYRFVEGIGIKPVMCGNIKGLQDPYRNPTTQEGYARQWKQRPEKVTSFADGTKISFEQAVTANATGMHVAQRGMLGPTVPPGTPIEEAVKEFPEELLLGDANGIVDYVVGASPGPGVFVVGTLDNARQCEFLHLFKMGLGPLYTFYTPYHLCHFEVHNTIARAMLFNDAAIAPLGAPLVEVVTAAKTDLKAGQTIDGIGYYMTYGLAENADVVARDGLLPIGVAEGCELLHDMPKDAVLTYADVRVPEGRLIDQLRDEQAALFSGLQIGSR